MQFGDTLQRRLGISLQVLTNYVVFSEVPHGIKFPMVSPNYIVWYQTPYPYEGAAYTAIYCLLNLRGMNLVG